MWLKLTTEAYPRLSVVRSVADDEQNGAVYAGPFASRAQGRDLGDGPEPMRFVTASLTIDFLRPTPIGEEVVVSGKLIGMDGRKVRVALALSAHGEVCARGEMLAIQFRN